MLLYAHEAVPEGVLAALRPRRRRRHRPGRPHTTGHSQFRQSANRVLSRCAADWRLQRQQSSMAVFAWPEEWVVGRGDVHDQWRCFRGSVASEYLRLNEGKCLFSREKTFLPDPTRGFVYPIFNHCQLGGNVSLIGAKTTATRVACLLRRRAARGREEVLPRRAARGAKGSYNVGRQRARRGLTTKKETLPTPNPTYFGTRPGLGIIYNDFFVMSNRNPIDDPPWS